DQRQEVLAGEQAEDQEHEDHADADGTAAEATAPAAPIHDVLADAAGCPLQRAVLRIYGVRNWTPDFDRRILEAVGRSDGSDPGERRPFPLIPTPLCPGVSG